MVKHAVIVVGGGPTGLLLAGELALAGVDVAIVERRATQALLGTRAGGLHARTIEVLDQRGIAARFLAEGQVTPSVLFSGMALDVSDFPTRHPYVLALGQQHIERLLAGWVEERAVPIYRSQEVCNLTQDERGVAIELADGQALRAEYVVGCDGGRSQVRKLAGIDFPGREPTTSNLIAEAELAETPAEWGVRRDAHGIHSLSQLEGGRVRVLVTEAQADHAAEPTLHDVRAALRTIYGTDYGLHSPTWISRFTDATRQAAAYRQGRILLAGDAAHIHPPDGGQGLQLGLQDAMNLGWKLAQVVGGKSPESLLDTYQAERYPVAAQVLQTTTAQVVLRRSDDRTQALREVLAELLVLDEPRHRYAGQLSGLAIHYDLGAGHPLLGRRMPDLDLVTAPGPRRVFALLHEARPLLLNFGQPLGLNLTPWQPRLLALDATVAGEWELPVVGQVAAPAAVLIRPDGYVAWVGDGTATGLREALTTWCGLG